jgi:cytochrome c oxidase accessory protein FixG
MSSIGDRPRTIGRGGKRVWIYPVEVRGLHTTLRNVGAVVLLIIFFVAPWLTISGQPFFRLNLLSGHFYLFGLPVLVHEFYHFVFLALLLAITLFAVSALFGRIWCGYACPQSIFIDRVFRLVERLIEGPALHRKRLDAGAKGVRYWVRKVVKQAVFLLISLLFAQTLVSYFAGVDAAFDPFHYENTTLVMVTLLTALAWFDGAYWREQFCVIACPYARFQSVMVDAHSLQVGYDVARGEPRGKNSRSVDGPLGDCIDCGLCQRVCPTGIDIRDGINQQECISCAKCIDACAGVMRSLGRAPGLVRYDTEANLNSDRALRHNDRRWAALVRPRTFVYAVVWLGLFGFGLAEFVNREAFHTRLITLPGAPFLVTDSGVKNHFALKIANQTSVLASYRLVLVEPENVQLESPDLLRDVRPGEERTLPVLVHIPVGVPQSDLRISIETVPTAGGESGAQLQKRFVTRPLVLP